MIQARRSHLNLQTGNVVVIGGAGLTGVIAELPDDRTALIRLHENQLGVKPELIKVETDQLRELPDGRLSLPLNEAQLQQLQDTAQSEESSRTVVPIAEEQLRVGRRTVETGRVTVDKTVTEREQTVDEPTFIDEAQVRRVPVNQVIDQPAEIHQQGDDLVIPLMEEVLVVEKKLMLREEVRITRTRREQREPQTHALRKEEARISRSPDPSTTPDPHNQDKDPHHG